jgi:hypothetical protein
MLSHNLFDLILYWQTFVGGGCRQKRVVNFDWFTAQNAEVHDHYHFPVTYGFPSNIQQPLLPTATGRKFEGTNRVERREV